jgi:hypothetical protein
MAVRPCEPVAQAAEQVGHLQVEETIVVGTPDPTAIPVESLPRVFTMKRHALAHTPKKSVGVCDERTEGAVCSYEDLQAGGPGGVLFCDCR